MSFYRALSGGDLDHASKILDELEQPSEADGLYLPECYGELAQAFNRQGRDNDAISAMEKAIEHGWSGRPDGRSDIAEFHLRAGRVEQAARIWAQLRSENPDEIWLYNAAGLSYSEIGEHELAIGWLAEGIEFAIRTGDPEGLVAQLSDVRRRSLHALGREPDELEQKADTFLKDQRTGKPELHARRSAQSLSDEAATTLDLALASNRQRSVSAVALSWFPGGQYEQAIRRWPSLAVDWDGVAHPDYCRRLDGHAKWMRAQGIRVDAIAPIIVEEFVVWCEQHGDDPEHARARYAAQRSIDGETISWPPDRNETCWCGSQRKYKKCCGPAPPAPIHTK